MKRTTCLPLLSLLVLLSACGSDAEDDLSAPAGGGSGGGSSAACEKDADCPAAAPVCDELAGKCVQCLFSTQCAPDERCTDQVCEAVFPCASSLDCVSHAPTTICEPATSTCVQCVEPADCPSTADCIDNVCEPYQPCDTSLDCTTPQVCDPARGKCVNCVSEADCREGEMCIGSECVVRTACVSDNQCTPIGKLCDKNLGYCADCFNNDACPDAYHCHLGSCVLDTCEAGAASCQGNALITCNAAGDGFSAPQPCPAGTTCQQGLGCVSSNCKPGTSCQSDTLVTCSPDGATVVSTVDCAAKGMRCIDAECSSLVCAPNQTYCEGSEVRRCNADGSGSTLVQACSTNQVCDTGTATCVSVACTPGALVCDGSIATKCNATGTGYEPGGKNCAAEGKGCSDGVCVGCPSGGGAPTSVRLAEVYIGNSDYIVLENRGSCSAQLDTLSIRVASSEPGNDLDLDMPAQVLAAGARVYLVDSGSEQTGDIVSPENIFLTPETGGSVTLCEGPCSSGNIIDYFAHSSGATAPAPPSGVAFAPSPLTGITASTQDAESYSRTQFTGAFPNFKAGDWQVAAASRPYVNSAECPPTQPDLMAPCGDQSVICTYGAVTCFCVMGWMCQ